MTGILVSATADSRFPLHRTQGVIRAGIFTLAMSVLFTLLPHMIGMGDYVDNGSRYQYFRQYLFEFVYCIVSVGAVEEFVFRGVIYFKIKEVFGRE